VQCAYLRSTRLSLVRCPLCPISREYFTVARALHATRLPFLRNRLLSWQPWLYEVKFNGYRMQVHKVSERITFYFLPNTPALCARFAALVCSSPSYPKPRGGVRACPREFREMVCDVREKAFRFYTTCAPRVMRRSSTLSDNPDVCAALWHRSTSRR
jgi:hypothetical protein